VTLGEVLRATAEYLSGKGIDTARLDSELILARALELTRLELYTSFERPLTRAELDAIRPLVARRGKREPLAYVLGEWGFRRLTLRTDARALVPRPETETVVERALAAIEGIEQPSVVDVGTGSGAIALSIVDERPDARVTATDVSPEALALARENAERLGLEIELREASLLDGVEGPFDLVVSNPPYVRPDEVETLQPEVRDWEPRLAVVGAEQTERLARAALGVLASGRALVLETHEGHAEQVRALLEELGYVRTAISRDLAGRERVVEGWKPGT